MLHEVLLSLSGHPSTLLEMSVAGSKSSQIISPPERALLASIAHLSDLNCKLLAQTARIPSQHPSVVCRAVATAVKSKHLADFQRKILEVEESILSKDAAFVGAYNIVPLATIVGEFSPWTRRMEWLWDITQFMINEERTGAELIDKLCSCLQTGYSDIEATALQLVRVAETSWLKQASSWILYGKLPSVGQSDFFVQEMKDKEETEFYTKNELYPNFVSPTTAGTILFIGKSLNQIRTKGTDSNAAPALVPSHLHLLSSLSFPITSSSLSSVVAEIRISLSQNALKYLLPLPQILEILALMRDFFLLGRGEFALALITEADQNFRTRWRRADNLGFDRREKLKDVVMKDSEVKTILSRTWASISTSFASGDGDDSQLEAARELITLKISKTLASGANLPKMDDVPKSSVPFDSLLLSIPTHLTLKIDSPLDLFLTPADVQGYSAINVYLLSIRRAQIHLTDLWKVSTLRRHHPAPPGPPYGSSARGRSEVNKFRARSSSRSRVLRTVWVTSSAAVFLLAETERYFQEEIIKEIWKGFENWMAGSASILSPAKNHHDNEDLWTSNGIVKLPKSKSPTYDPQTLAEAHAKYLRSLTHCLLLTNTSFASRLYHLLQQIDSLVALVHRIQLIWQSLDLEADEGVVDAFSDFHKEESDVKEQLVTVAQLVKKAIENFIETLQDIDQENDTRYNSNMDTIFDELEYVPAKTGRVDRLLMKLDFGSWFESKSGRADQGEHIDDDDIDG